METGRQAVQAVLDGVNSVLLGKENVAGQVLAALLAGGHVLLEDLPGVGKTTLAVALARLLGLDWRRVQFTPDVLPSDLTGFSVYNREAQTFVYQPGSVFCNLLLADEINRTSPKTQSALLEVMEERQVTVEGVTRAVPSPFFVIATQNPAGSAGTQLLPAAQVDRFMICTSIGYPDFESEVKMARGARMVRSTEGLRPQMDAEALSAVQKEVEGVYVHDAVLRYAVRLVEATRRSALLELGASPRATLSLIQMARATAWLAARDFITPDDVAACFTAVVRHRVVPSVQARLDGVSPDTVLAGILRDTQRPKLREK